MHTTFYTTLARLALQVMCRSYLDCLETQLCSLLYSPVPLCRALQARQIPHLDQFLGPLDARFSFLQQQQNLRTPEVANCAASLCR